MRMWLVAGVTVVGCGGCSSSKSLDCAYLAGNNCWKTTVAEATTCLPAAGTTGKLSADNSSCAYASGQTITFTPALGLPLASGFKDWNFTVTTGGQPCLHYEESAGGFELTVRADAVSEMISGAAGIDLTCPDGTTYSNSNALTLLDCPGSAFGDLPGNTTSSDSTSVTFGLINTGTPSSVTVFDCSR
ncbi:MAG TPA: hypothetical protein VF516_03510 [Kofleriaceae bacterium]